MKILKSILISAMISSLIWQGCYSFRTVDNNDIVKDPIIDEEEIVLTLTSGDEIYSDKNQHHYIKQTGDFYYGKTDKSSPGFSDNFIKIDCADIAEDSTYADSNRVFTSLKLKSGQTFLFRDQNLLRIKSEDKPGLRLKGYVIRDSGDMYEYVDTFVDKGQIAGIEMKKISTAKTIGAVFLYAAGVTLLIGIIVIGKNLPRGGYNF